MSNIAKDYKHTLLMPQTNFEMRANLVEKEKKFRDFWEKNAIYNQVLKSRKNNPHFILHDGPPYANGDLHIGHALNKILKDIVVRYKILQGFYSPFILGWDTHGLPIENKMLEVLKMTKDDLKPLTLRKEAQKYAQSQIENQQRQFRLMQLFTDYDYYYKTFSPDYEANQLKVLKKMLLEGLITKGLKPIYWSPTLQTALAEAEIEYKNITSSQIYVAFKVNNFKQFKHLSLLIMTTTPWTLIANAGVAVGQNIDYSIVKINDSHVVIAQTLVKKVLALADIKEYQIVASLSIQELLTLTYDHPLNKHLTCPVVLGKHVSIDEGTGLVHTAPLFGEDDYEIGVKNHLNLIMHVNPDGTFNDQGLQYQGMYYLKANKLIIEDLLKTKQLLINQLVSHSYPHDWRTHKPVIYRASEQWFLSINSLKKDLIKHLKTVQSFPQWGVERIENMVTNREQWTISRQRTWGVPLIIFYDQNHNPIIKEDILDYVINLVAQHGSNIWWTKGTDELLPQKYRNQQWTREFDILDVWFDSGCSFLAPELQGLSPDLYLEGNDQYRGWFNSSLINSVAFQNKAPFKILISHGFVLDEKNQKMSKSLGNVVDPLAIINEHGADILRLWVASVEYSSDVNVSKNIVSQILNMYRNLRTKIRFMLGNLHDFKFNNHVQTFTGLDALIHEQLNNLKLRVKHSFDSFQFNHGLREINNFIVDLSSYYFEVNKDTLYVEKANSPLRRAVQSNLYDILKFVLKTCSIFLPTTCEEAYQHFNVQDKKISIFFEQEHFKAVQSHAQHQKWKSFFNLKDQVFKLIEQAKQAGLIKRSQEAWLVLDKAAHRQFEQWHLTKLLMVGKITFEDVNEIRPFTSVKCSRCWNHFEKPQVNDDLLCSRCQSVLKS